MKNGIQQHGLQRNTLLLFNGIHEKNCISEDASLVGIASRITRTFYTIELQEISKDIVSPFERHPVPNGDIQSLINVAIWIEITSHSVMCRWPSTVRCKVVCRCSDDTVRALFIYGTGARIVNKGIAVSKSISYTKMHMTGSILRVIVPHFVTRVHLWYFIGIKIVRQGKFRVSHISLNNRQCAA